MAPQRKTLVLLALASLLSGACGGAPRTRARSADAPARCAQARGVAGAARSAWRRHDNPASRNAVAGAVFALARCEAAGVDLVEVTAGDAPVEQRLRGVREQYIRARSVLIEVRRYDVERWNVASAAETISLDERFAHRLRTNGIHDIAAAFERQQATASAARRRAP